MVVDDEDPDRPPARWSRAAAHRHTAGRRGDRRPGPPSPPGPGATTSSPPSRSARSRIDTRPSPGAGVRRVEADAVVGDLEQQRRPGCRRVRPDPDADRVRPRRASRSCAAPPGRAGRRRARRRASRSSRSSGPSTVDLPARPGRPTDAACSRTARDQPVRCAAASGSSSKISARMSSSAAWASSSRVRRQCRVGPSAGRVARGASSAARMCSVIENSCWQAESCSSRASRCRSSSAASPRTSASSRAFSTATAAWSAIDGRGTRSRRRRGRGPGRQ